MSNKQRAFFKIILFIIYYILGITFLIPLIFSFVIYNFMFGKRCEKTEKCLSEKDFDQLVYEPCNFMSGKTQLDASFYYNKGIKEYKALIVFCHGIGCGRQNYLNRIDYFTKQGYLVFSFDLTGCVNSGGKGLKGLPQATQDLRSALNYVKAFNQYQPLPILLYGHSWSGYACTAIMNEQDFGVSAVVSCSGFDNSLDLGMVFMEKEYRAFRHILKLYLRIVEYIKFGKTSRYSAIGGINKFGKPVLVAHSKDDETIRFKGSIFNHKGKCVNPYARFILFEDRGHTLSRPRDCEKIIREKFVANSDYRKLEKNESMFKYHVDMHYNNASLEEIYGLDTDFMEMVCDFYDKALKNN